MCRAYLVRSHQAGAEWLLATAKESSIETGREDEDELSSLTSTPTVVCCSNPTKKRVLLTADLMKTI